MELQVSCGICAKIQEKSILRREKTRDKRNIKNIVPMERSRDNRGRSMPRPYTFTTINTPKISVSGFMGYLKGKSSLMIFQKYGNLKFAYRNREFWCRGFYVDTSGKDTKAIKEYIKNQLKQDQESDQLSIFNPQDPFTGSK